MKKIILTFLVAFFGMLNLTAQNVLIIYDNSSTSPDNLSLSNALIADGFSVTYSAVNESSWDNTNPSLTGFDAVIHMNGTSYEAEMPVAGQEALTDFVQNNNGLYVGFEWNAYQVGDLSQMMSMVDLVLFERTSADYYANAEHITVPGQESHPVLANVPTSFSLPSYMNIGTIRTFASEPSEVLMTFSTNDAVAIRHFGNGHVLGFSNAGNYLDGTVNSNTNIQQIIINFINEYAITSANISKNLLIELDVFPNPTSSILTINTDATIESIQILDLNGTLVQTEKSNTFSVETLAEGMYILTITTDKGSISKRFVKK